MAGILKINSRCPGKIQYDYRDRDRIHVAISQGMPRTNSYQQKARISGLQNGELIHFVFEATYFDMAALVLCS